MVLHARLKARDARKRDSRSSIVAYQLVEELTARKNLRT
jgi:hypothetical protein